MGARFGTDSDRANPASNEMMMEELHSELGVIADLSALEMRASATAKMAAKGIKQVEIDVLQNTAFPLNEAAEMRRRLECIERRLTGRIPRVRGHRRTRRCVVH